MPLSICLATRRMAVMAIALNISLSASAPAVLSPDALHAYTDRFAEEDRWYFQVGTDAEVSQVNKGVYGGQFVKNAQAFDWLKENVPLFDAPDTVLLRTYYFRWWTFRKHIKNIGTTQSPSFVITEFIDPVDWSDGSTNTIAAPLGHHIYEGRWLLDAKIVKDYESYWLKNAIANPRRYSAWLADAVFASYLVHQDTAHVLDLLLSNANRLNLVKNWSGWNHASSAPGGAAQQAYYNAVIHLFWQNTDRDAMENSLTGDGYKPSLNAYLYGDAKATAQMFRLAAKAEPGNAAAHLQNAGKFDSTARVIKKAVQDLSWDPGKNFFMNGYYANSVFSRAAKREEVGFTPWSFGLPDDGGAVDYDKAWQNTVNAASVFKSAYGLTSGAQNESGFNPGAAGDCCRWDGPIWPFATSLTLKGFANLLHDYQQTYVTKADYYQALSAFAAGHQITLSRGGRTRSISWIDESMTANTGQWVRILFNGDTTKPRGYAYNHSTFNDLIISDLIGLRPRGDDTVEVNPLVPDDWRFFALDNVSYHGKILAIIWDQDGTKYGLGQGLQILVNGKPVARSAALKKLIVRLNAQPMAAFGPAHRQGAVSTMKYSGRRILIRLPGAGHSEWVDAGGKSFHEGKSQP